MGLANMAIAMSCFMGFFSTGSLSDVLVQRGQYEKEAGQSVWLSLCLTLSLTILIALLAPISILLGHKDLFFLLLIVSASTLTTVLSPVLGARLKINFDFKHLAISDFLSNSSFIGFAVLFAYMGLGPFSLVLAMVPRALIGSAYIIWREGWPPFERPRINLIKKLFKPTISLSTTNFLTSLQAQAPIFCVGLALDSTSIGYFSWAWMVASQTVFLLAVNLRHVLMPVFSKLNENQDRQIGAVLKTIRSMTALLIITCGLQSLLAVPLVSTFFPLKWHPAGPVISYISLGLIAQGVLISVSAWLNAMGMYRKLLWTNALPVVAASVLAYFGALEKGVQGAALGAAVGLFAGDIISLRFIPFKNLKENFKTFFLPLAINSFSLFVFQYYFSSSDTWFKNIFFSLTFLIISGSTWWFLDDGILKNLVINNFRIKRIFK